MKRNHQYLVGSLGILFASLSALPASAAEDNRAPVCKTMEMSAGPSPDDSYVAAFIVNPLTEAPCSDPDGDVLELKDVDAPGTKVTPSSISVPLPSATQTQTTVHYTVSDGKGNLVSAAITIKR
jgi:hypothetical protein